MSYAEAFDSIKRLKHAISSYASLNEFHKNAKRRLVAFRLWRDVSFPRMIYWIVTSDHRSLPQAASSEVNVFFSN